MTTKNFASPGHHADDTSAGAGWDDTVQELNERLSRDPSLLCRCARTARTGDRRHQRREEHPLGEVAQRVCPNWTPVEEMKSSLQNADHGPHGRSRSFERGLQEDEEL
ncbi:MAG: hypothetical protein U0X93_07530 [Anaerolineales bacterium]